MFIPHRSLHQDIQRTLELFFSNVRKDLVFDRPGFLHAVCGKQPGEDPGQVLSGKRRMTENIPEKVSLVALPSDPLKMLPDGIFESLVIVGDDQISAPSG